MRGYLYGNDLSMPIPRSLILLMVSMIVSQLFCEYVSFFFTFQQQNQPPPIQPQHAQTGRPTTPSA